MNTIIRTIPECNLSFIEAQMLQLNKKAAKLQCPCLFMTVERDGVKPLYECWHAGEYYFTEDETSKHRTGVMVPRVRVTLTGESPKLDGWEFLATLTPTENGNLISVVPFAPPEMDLTEFRDKMNQCDHCNTKRQRKETFLVWHRERNEIKMVGRSCLKDFLGHMSAEQLADIASMLTNLFNSLQSIDDLESDVRGRRRMDLCHVDLVKYLAQAHSVVKKYGYVSRQTAEEKCILSTGDGLWMHFFPMTPKQQIQEEVTEQDTEIANRIIQWMLNVPHNGNAYLLNLQTCARNEYVDYKSRGYVASAVTAYYRAQQTDTSTSQHIGEKGSRITLRLKCVKITATNGYYGMTGVHVLHDENRNVFVWFASGSTEWLEQNETVLCTATIKDHTSFRGVNQTSLSRLKIVTSITDFNYAEVATEAVAAI